MSDSGFLSPQQGRIDLSQINPKLTQDHIRAFRETAHQSLNGVAARVINSPKRAPVGPTPFEFDFDLETNFELDTVTPDTADDELLIYQEIIRANKLAVLPYELKRWLNTDPDDLAKNNEIKAIDQKMLTQLAPHKALVNSSFFGDPNSGHDIGDHTRKICRIHVTSPAGMTSTGIGVFLTGRLVMTCWHVVEEPKVGMRLEIEVPHYHGPHELSNDIFVWSGIRYRVKESLGKPHLLAQSQTLPDNLERDAWPDDPPPAQALDYCLFEIDLDSERWTLSQSGPRAQVFAANAGFVVSILSNQFPAMRLPTALYEADELGGNNVVVHTLSETLKIETRNAGNVNATSPAFQRIRYGEGDNGLAEGSSGSPVSNDAGELVAMHNAATGQMSQAIPIGPIVKDIKRQNIPLWD